MSSNSYFTFSFITGAVILVAGVLYAFRTGRLLSLLVAVIAAAVWMVMQYAIVTILANQEEILSLLKPSMKVPSSKPVSNSKLDLSKVAGTTRGDWVCPSCGEKNPESSRNCRSCDQPK